MEPAALPLDGVVVIDLTRQRAGPTAARHLGDWGADVIRVEEMLGPDAAGGIAPRDGSDFQNLHRNKRAITLNLKAPEGKELFLKLARRADVIVENYRPDVKRRLGIDYESIRQENPRIVYGSISGFGQTGPYRDRPGVDQIAQGMGGLMSITGLPGQGPVRAGIAISDVTAGLSLAFGILLALYQRERTGQGQWVSTSLVEALITMIDFQAARWLVDHEVPEQAGNEHPTLMPTGVFATADGHINIAAANDSMFARLCKAMEMPELLDEPDYKTSRLRGVHRVPLMATLGERILTKTSAYWVETLNEAGVPCGPIYSLDQTFNDPQVQQLGMAAPVEHPRLGHMNLVAQAISLSGIGGRPTIRRHAPDYSQDTDAVLATLGYDDAAIAGLRERGVV